MKSTLHTVDVNESDAGTRLDKFLSRRLAGFSRSRLKALIESGCVVLNGTAIEDASAKVKHGQSYEVHIPEAKPSHLVPQKMELDIVYEDDDMLILNKPPGLTVHPGAGNPDHTLVNALLAHCGSTLSGIGGVARPGIVHRIDKDTSGLLAVAKNDAAHAALSGQLAARTLKRTYLALVWGAPKSRQGTITGNIGRSRVNRQKMTVLRTGGKPAVTHYKTLENFYPPLFSLLECQLETGRTHQIRVHLTHLGHPLVGDPVYGQKTSQRLKSGIYKVLPDDAKQMLIDFNRQALHAKKLELAHPTTGKKMRFTADIPGDMKALLASLA